MIETKLITTGSGEPEEICAKCEGDLDWEDCPNCEEGYSHHDCGEDCCACRNPQPNVICTTCDGKGGRFRCYSCESEQNKPEVNTPCLSKKNTKEDGFPPITKVMGIQPTIL